MISLTAVATCGHARWLTTQRSQAQSPTAGYLDEAQDLHGHMGAGVNTSIPIGSSVTVSTHIVQLHPCTREYFAVMR
jgi:hypothetical protein